MSDDKSKIGAMFEKAFANRAAKVAEEKKEQEEQEKQNKKEEIIEEPGEEIQNEEDVSEETQEVPEEILEEEDDVVEEVSEELEETENEVKEDIEEDEIQEETELGDKNNEEENDNHTTMIDIELLEDFPNQPFKIYSEEKEKEMIDSIKVNGIIHDLIVRPLNNGKYQILSGHNRKNCAIKAGLKEVPCKVKEVDDDTAKLMLVDTNLVQRKELYPSETAKALQMKRDVYKRKGVKSDFFDDISKEQSMSRGNVQRYLRLNYLIPELMNRVDTKEMTMKIAEDISFLTTDEQKKLEEKLEAKPRKLTGNQAKRLKEESDKNNLTETTFKVILENAEKEDDKDIEIKFTKEEIDRYFKDFGNVKEMKEFIISMLEELITVPEKKVEENG